MVDMRKNNAMLTTLAVPLLRLHRGLKQLFSKQYGPPLAIYGFVALGLPIAFMPSDVLSTNPWLTSFVAFLEQYIPMVKRLSLPTAFPEVAKLYYSSMWALAPFWIYCLFITPDDRLVPIEHQRRHKIMIPIWYVSFLFLIVFFGVMDSGDANRPLRGIMSLTQHSRVGLGLLGGLLMAAVVGIPYLIVIWIKRIPRIYRNFP